MKNIKCKKCKSENIHMYYHYRTLSSDDLNIKKLTLSKWVDKYTPDITKLIFQCESCGRNNYNVEEFNTKEELLTEWIEV